MDSHNQEFVPATLYHIEYSLDPFHGTSQTVREIFIPSIHAIINYATDMIGDKQINVRPCESLPTKCNPTFDKEELILDHTEIKLSREFVDSVKSIMLKNQEIEKLQTDLLQMDEALFLGDKKSN